MITSRTFENALENRVILPGGFFQNEVYSREVILHPPTGKVEELIGGLSDLQLLASSVTALLTQCIERIGPITDITPEIVRSLLVGDRDYLILRLRQMIVGDIFEAILVCQNPQCGKRIDMDFDLKHIPIKQGNISSQFFISKLPRRLAFEDNEGHKHYQIEFRLPNGGDQEELVPPAVNNEGEAVSKLLTRCIKQIGKIINIDESCIEKLSLPARRKIEKKMAELAPQVELEMEAKCPECKETFPFNLNISQFFIDEMKDNLNQLYQDVHFLGFYYKWSESDVLSMSRKKRRKYMELLSEQIEKNKQRSA